jgi:hypothetical protein
MFVSRTARAPVVPEQRPAEAEVDLVEQPRQHELEQNCDQRHEPQRGPDIGNYRAQSAHGRWMIAAARMAAERH